MTDVRIVSAQSTDLFIGSEAVPLQVVLVTVAVDRGYPDALVDSVRLHIECGDVTSDAVPIPAFQGGLYQPLEIGLDLTGFKPGV